MTDPKQIAETVARLREGVLSCGMHEDNSTELFLIDDANDEMWTAADLLQSLAAENAALKAEAEAAAARLAEVEAERDALETAREMLGGFWAKDNARAEAAEAERDACHREINSLTAMLAARLAEYEAERDRLAAELAEAREWLQKAGVG